AARAADPAPAPADSIATAKSDLAAIRSPLAQPELNQALPSLDMKDVGAVPATATPDFTELLKRDEERGPNGLKAKKEGTGNWLIDAMDKSDPKAAEKKGRYDLLKTDSDALRGDERPGARTQAEFVTIDQGRDRAPEAEPAKKQAYNPLDSFMSGWISAKDQEVLLPVSKGEITASDTPKAHPENLQNLELGPSGSAAEPLVPGLDAVSAPDSKVAANPYLPEVDTASVTQLKAFTAPDLPAFGASELSDPVRAAPAAGLDTRPADNGKGIIPDFAQPTDDDKYFKQMKRF
ncbi:MAG TPA: hypothetical protein VIJ19_11785, partial [Opitutaceae bacterium]